MNLHTVGMDYNYTTTESLALKALEKYDVTEGGVVTNGEKVVSAYTNHGGYKLVSLYVDGKARNFRVHRLVALKYYGPSGGRAVNHIDGDKSNNHKDNLEYTSLKDNIKHYWSRGEYHPRIKLTKEMVEYMRNEYKAGRRTIRSMAEEFNLNYTYACQAVRGMHWK